MAPLEAHHVGQREPPPAVYVAAGVSVLAYVLMAAALVRYFRKG